MMGELGLTLAGLRAARWTIEATPAPSVTVEAPKTTPKRSVRDRLEVLDGTG
jgi:hypothetical protein